MVNAKQRNCHMVFTNKLLNGDKIKIFNYGNCKRDFTYIDDIVEGVLRVIKVAPEKQNGEDGLPVPPYKVYNIKYIQGICISEIKKHRQRNV